MAEKRILAIGVSMASSQVHQEEVTSKISLLDWDIVLFCPRFLDHFSYSQMYKGKPCLGDQASFRLKEATEHWRRELKQAFEAGKTIIIFLPPLEDFYVDSGAREYSGTGRNRHVTMRVDEFSNYKALPLRIGPVPSTGSSMRLSDKAAAMLSGYWSEFGDRSTYQVLLTEPDVPQHVVTKAAAKVVGAVYRSKVSAGSMALLPYVDFEAREFFALNADVEVWSEEGKRFGARMIAACVALDRVLRATSEVTPEPGWVSGLAYALHAEAALQMRLMEAEREVELAQQRKEQLAEQLRIAGEPRALLYENGKRLEAAIIAGLRVLGFSAASYKDSESEFDVVFECGEGRLLGEAEGKDGKAINIEKLRQLSMNVHEDLRRETVTTPAKPVLFGNAYRLLPIAERPDPFTEKCKSAAAASSTALVATHDLFRCVQYLAIQDDPHYARLCREAILSTTGRVEFPEPPADCATSVARLEEGRGLDVASSCETQSNPTGDGE